MTDEEKLARKREQNRLRVVAYRARYPERHRASVKATRAKKPEQYKAKLQEWRAANVDKIRESRESREDQTARMREWRRANPSKAVMHMTKRRDVIKERTPRWLSPAHYAEMDGMYLFCNIFPGFQVDHVVPLQGKKVSGLHVPWNMQVLPAAENIAKGNKFEG